VLTGLTYTVSAQTSVPTVAVPEGPGSLAGIWLTGGAANRGVRLASAATPERDRVARTSDGEWPPLQPWASELLEKRIKLSQEGNPEALALTQCLPAVPAMLLGSPYPIQILETPGQVTMLLEEQNHFRIIHLNGTHPEDPDPTFLGHSVGRWEGNTLVVDTVALTERTPLDRIGTPHSDALHLIERYRRSGPGTLDVTITVEDSKSFTKPWDVKLTYRSAPPTMKMTEYICENNRDY
jgi:hypothetical protein